jgi:hypothetical protein
LSAVCGAVVTVGEDGRGSAARPVEIGELEGDVAAVGFGGGVVVECDVVDCGRVGDPWTAIDWGVDGSSVILGERWGC